MVYVDIILIALILWGAYSGFKKGFLKQIVSTTSLLLGIYVATTQKERLIPVIESFEVTESSALVQIIAFALLFIGVLVFLNVTNFLVEKFLKLTGLSFFNKLLGGFLGGLKFGIIASFICFLAGKTVDFLPLSELQSEMNNLTLYPILLNISRTFLENYL